MHKETARGARSGQRRKARRGPLRIALIYASVATAWIVISDHWLDRFGADLILVSIAKGLFFVAATAWMLYVLVRRHSCALGRAERRMRAIIESMTDPVLVADRQGRVAHANQAALGLFAPDIVGRSTGDAFGRHVDVLAAALRGEPSPASEMVADSPAGTRRTFSVRASPIWEEAEIVGAVATLRDVSELRESEQRHRTLSAELVESHKRKDEFMAMLSHELRNPLAPIANSLFILGRTELGSEQSRRALTVIDRQVRHLTRLVNSLLDARLIRAGEIRLVRERVDVGNLVREVSENQRSSFEKAGIALKVETVPGLHAMLDPTRMGQVVQEMLANAAKFSERGGWASARVEAEGAWALLRICNDGVGIAPDLLPRLFEPFVQGETGLDRSKGGLGLGLAMVKDLVELQGGSVVARSEGKGTGAEFIVRLPLA